MDVDSIVLVEERVLNVIVMEIVGNDHVPALCRSELLFRG